MRPVRWGLGDVVAGFVVALVGSQIVLAIVLAASGRSVDEVDDLPLSLVLLAQVGLWAGLFGAPWLATRLKGDGLVADLQVRVERRDLWRGGGLGVLLQLVAVPLVSLPWIWLLGEERSELERSAEDLIDRAIGPLGVILLVLIVVIGAPIIEEVFYRGFMLGALRNRGLSPVLANVVTATVFAASHFQMIQFPALLVFGLAAGVLAQRAGRLGPAIAAHVAFNLVTVLALLAVE